MNYTKDFMVWSEVKKVIQDRSSIPPGYKEREVWWAQIGINIGDEEDGKGVYFSRPVLIIRGFSKYIVWVMPLSSVLKTGRYYHPIKLNGVSGVVILSQLRSLDTRRFTSRIGVLDEINFQQIKHKLVDIIL